MTVRLRNAKAGRTEALNDLSLFHCLGHSMFMNIAYVMIWADDGNPARMRRHGWNMLSIHLSVGDVGFHITR